MQYKLIILDVDGVMTNGKKTYDRNGFCISKEFYDQDFTAIKKLRAAGLAVVFLSGDAFNESLANRRNIPFYLARPDPKDVILPKILEDFKVSAKEVIFVGDDIFDYVVGMSVGLALCPKDATRELLTAHRFKVLPTNGGEGVVRNLYEYCRHNKIIDVPDMDKVFALDKDEKF